MKPASLHIAPTLLRTLCSLLAAAGLVNSLYGQTSPVKVSVAPDTILIGEQVTYTVSIEIDSADTVFFPTGQTFLPLEVIDTPAIDSSFSGRTTLLRKIYGLSAYDSGNYTIPIQQITVNRVPLYTDSFRIRVQPVVVDTIKQGLFDIKDVQKVRARGPGFWDFLPYLLLLVLASFIGLWYYLVRSRSALSRFRRGWDQLSPAERAEHLLNELGASRLLLENQVKEYYTRLTDTLRAYLEQRMGITASELTTAQLLDILADYRLEEGEAGQFEFSQDQRTRLSDILQRADLVKFAKWNPGPGLPEQDLSELLALVGEFEQAYREVLREERLEEEKVNQELEVLALRRKFLFNRIAPAVGVAVLLLVVAWQLGWLVPGELKEGRTLIAKEWVRSTYGFPPIAVQTPDVLIRQKSLVVQEPDTSVVSLHRFRYQLRGGLFSIEVQSAELRDKKSDPPIASILEERFQEMEGASEARNLITKEEKFQTPAGRIGLKVFGSGEFLRPGSKEFVKGHYAIIAFGGPGFYQLLHLTWRLDDPASQQVADRILNSIEVSTEL